MNAETIRTFAGSMPSNYPKQTTSFGGTSSKVERIRFALSDPMFGWNYAMSYTIADQDMPVDFHFFPVRYAYYWKRFGAENDHVEEAHALTHPSEFRIRNVLQALLLCADVTFEKIGQLLNLSIETVEAYECLFFNVRDRLDDRANIASIVFPGT